MLIVDVSILLIWSLIDPLHFVRARKETDFDQWRHPLRSQGGCTADTAWLYMTPLAILHALVLLYGNHTAYTSRAAPSEYQVSRYIALSVAAYL